MIFAIVAAASFVRFRSQSWETYGFDFAQPWKRLAGWGFLCGALMVLLVTIPEVVWGPRTVRDPVILSDVIQRFVKGLLSGVTVGVVEEFFFRGFIYTHLARRIGPALGVMAASAFYSLSHFFDNGQIFIPPSPGLGDAFRLSLGYLEPLAFHPLRFLPEFFGLFLFGVALNLAFIRTRSLFLAIGIHAGAVFLVKFQNAFLRKGPELYHPFFGSQPHYDGVFEWLLVAVFAAMLYWVAPKPPRFVSPRN